MCGCDLLKADGVLAEDILLCVHACQCIPTAYNSLPEYIKNRGKFRYFEFCMEVTLCSFACYCDYDFVLEVLGRRTAVDGRSRYITEKLVEHSFWASVASRLLSCCTRA